MICLKGTISRTFDSEGIAINQITHANRMRPSDFVAIACADAAHGRSNRRRTAGFFQRRFFQQVPWTDHMGSIADHQPTRAIVTTRF